MLICGSTEVQKSLFQKIHHGKRTDSFLGNGSVQRKQSILRKNDTYINCRGDPELSKYTKRGGKKGGQKSLDAHEHRIPASKMGKIHDFCSGGLNTKGGAKGGASFQNVGSDHLYHDTKLWWLFPRSNLHFLI